MPENLQELFERIDVSKYTSIRAEGGYFFQQGSWSIVGYTADGLRLPLIENLPGEQHANALIDLLFKEWALRVTAS